MKKTFLLTICIILLSGCSLSNEWTGFYYQDKNDIGNSTKQKIQSGFKSKEDCRNWIIQTAGNNDNFDYECGLNCKLNNYNTYTCKETIK